MGRGETEKGKGEGSKTGGRNGRIKEEVGGRTSGRGSRRLWRSEAMQKTIKGRKEINISSLKFFLLFFGYTFASFEGLKMCSAGEENGTLNTPVRRGHEGN